MSSAGGRRRADVRTRRRPPGDPREAIAREQARARRERWGRLLDSHLEVLGLPAPTRELRFDARGPGRDRQGKRLPRAWRFDRSWPELRIAVEVEGVTYGGGRHQRKAGFEADAEKYLEAIRQGWTLVRVTPLQIKLGFAIAALEDVFEGAGVRATGKRGDIT